MRGAWILALPYLLGGCIAPPGVAIASMAADGASYAATGKSVTDHGVSTVKDQDCKTLRVFTGGAICKDPKHPAPAAPFEDRQARPDALVVPASAGAPAAIPPEGQYFAIGTFADRRRAEIYARRYADYFPHLVPTSFAGRALLRLVLGPLDPQHIARLRERGVAGVIVERPGSAVPAVAISPVPGVPG